MVLPTGPEREGGLSVGSEITLLLRSWECWLSRCISQLQRMQIL